MCVFLLKEHYCSRDSAVDLPRCCVLRVCVCGRKMHETCWQVISRAKASHWGHNHKVTLTGGWGWGGGMTVIIQAWELLAILKR